MYVYSLLCVRPTCMHARPHDISISSRSIKQLTMFILQLVPTKSFDWTRGIPCVLLQSITAMGLFTIHVSLCFTGVLISVHVINYYVAQIAKKTLHCKDENVSIQNIELNQKGSSEEEGGKGRSLETLTQTSRFSLQPTSTNQRSQQTLISLVVAQ